MSRPLAVLLSVAAAAAVAASAAPPAAAQDRAVTERLQERIRLRVEGEPGSAAARDSTLRSDGRRIQAARSLRRFYGERVHLPAWVGADGRVLPRAREALAGLRSAREHGLPPDDYHAARIESLLSELDAGREGAGARFPDAATDRRLRLLAELDLLLTDAFLTYGSHLVSGRVDPRSIDPLWTVNGRERDMAALLGRTLEAGRSPRAVLADLAPRHPGYARLQRALTAYRRLASAGGWPTVPEGPALRAGEAGPRVAALRRRLAASGELSADDGGNDAVSDTVFDDPLDAAVRSFQRRHGLEADGIVGEGTLGALNVPAGSRVSQIERNLERWRWLPAELGETHLRVNIADFGLEVVEGDSTVLSMRAVVGRDYRQTPVFSDTMRYVVLNPTWNVPRSIAGRDILPRLKESISYLEEQGMVVYRGWSPDAPPVDPSTVDWSRLSADSLPYRFVQRPGPLNALGRVKFMFPNQFAVYIHDSPARSLFGRSVRSFSSGCIRVERPLELLDYVLRGREEWSPAKLRGALETGREQTIRLPRELPVHIEYWTAWAGEDGAVHFRPDVYGRDARLASALEAAPPGD